MRGGQAHCVNKTEFNKGKFWRQLKGYNENLILPLTKKVKQTYSQYSLILFGLPIFSFELIGSFFYIVGNEKFSTI